MLQIPLLIFLVLPNHRSCCTVELGEEVSAPRMHFLAVLQAQAETASVGGSVKASTGQLPPEMVVYLEPKDSNARFPVPSARPRVSQKGAQFAPSLVVISVGQSVEFMNDEDRPIEHNVFSNSPALPFDLGLFPQRESRVITFDKPGPVVLHCSVHKYMDGVVFVAPSPFFCKVDSAGKYNIANVPSGEYTLRLWQRRPRFPEVVMPMRVEEGKSAQLDLELKRK